MKNGDEIDESHKSQPKEALSQSTLASFVVSLIVLLHCIAFHYRARSSAGFWLGGQ